MDIKLISGSYSFQHTPTSHISVYHKLVALARNSMSCNGWHWYVDTFKLLLIRSFPTVQQGTACQHVVKMVALLCNLWVNMQAPKIGVRKCRQLLISGSRLCKMTSSQAFIPSAIQLSFHCPAIISKWLRSCTSTSSSMCRQAFLQHASLIST